MTAVGAGAGAAVIAVGADERDARSGLGLVTSFVRHPAERRGHTAGAGATWGERRAGDVDVNEVFTRPLGLSQGLCIWLCICSVSAKKADTLYPAVHVSVDPNHCM